MNNYNPQEIEKKWPSSAKASEGKLEVKKVEKPAKVVIPAKAGIQSKSAGKTLDSRLHGNDKEVKADVRKTEVKETKIEKSINACCVFIV